MESLRSDTLESALPAKLGGPKAVESYDASLFHWPIVTSEDEEAVLGVLREGSMSGTEITKLFEREFAEWMGVPYALGACNGTAGLLAAMWACEVGAGTEIICPSMTYWASAMPALQLGATVNFADIERDSLCIDPADIEHRIGPKTKAIVVVHYAGHPADMDRIMPIARKHGVRVIEDTSHAQGAMYKGRMCGTIGDIGVMSLMAGKSFAVGEGGMSVTRDQELYERCVAYGHYERTGVASNYNKADASVTSQDLKRFAGSPIGGVKHRMNQTCAAMGRVQLRHYPERIAVIQSAMNRFWDLLEGTPGIRPHRVTHADSTMGGWYYARALYWSEELGGLTSAQFCEALAAEGVPCGIGGNRPLHTMAVFHEADIFRQGMPTAIAFGQRDVRQGPGTLPVSESVPEQVISAPWFKHDEPAIIARFAAAYRKVALQADRLLATTI